MWHWYRTGHENESGQSKEAKPGGPSKLKKSHHNLKNALKCLYLNARSLCDKMHELITAVEDSTPGVIGVSETWGTLTPTESPLMLTYEVVPEHEGRSGH